MPLDPPVGGASISMNKLGSVVDVHAHVSPQRFQKAVENGGDWLGMTADDGELWNPKMHWGLQERLDDMDALQVDIQVVAPNIDFYQYHRKPADTIRIASEVNDEIAEMVRERPDRLMGLGTLPMQSIDGANGEMVRGMKDLGLVGFMINDHVNGLTYDKEHFDPFWEAAEELGAVIFFHQGRDTSAMTLTKDYFLWNSVGALADRALTFGCLVYGGVMDKHPNLEVCLCHAGGFTSFVIDRMDKAWDGRSHLRGKALDRPSTYLKRFYFDTVTFEPRTLRFLVDVVGADRVLFGTDWPTPMMVDGVRGLEVMEGLEGPDREAILKTNAAGLFRNAEGTAPR